MLPSNFSGLGPSDPPGTADFPAGDLLAGKTTDGRNATGPLGSVLRHGARPLLVFVVTHIGIWGCGWLVRFLARSDEVARLASMILFAPVPVVAIWFGWRTRWRVADWIAASLSLVLGFLVWNSVMLQGLGDPSQLREVILRNASHWILFLVAGVTTARWIQWVSRIGIWSVAGSAEAGSAEACSTEAGSGEIGSGEIGSGEEPEAKPLSVIRLMGITATVAVLAVACRVIFGASIEEASPWVEMGFPNGPTHWYTWFPLSSKIWVSGAIGGLLVGIHWFAIVGILKSGSYRMAGLVLWIVVAAGLRWSANQIYWDTTLPPILSDRGLPPLFGHPASRPVPIAIQMIIEASLQTIITCASVYWLRGCGYRIGRRGRAPLP